MEPRRENRQGDDAKVKRQDPVDPGIQHVGQGRIHGGGGGVGPVLEPGGGIEPWDPSLDLPLASEHSNQVSLRWASIS